MLDSIPIFVINFMCCSKKHPKYAFEAILAENWAVSDILPYFVITQSNRIIIWQVKNNMHSS